MREGQFHLNSSCYHALPFILMNIMKLRLKSVRLRMVQRFFLR